MKFKNPFKKDKEPDPFSDLTLESMQPGYVVDYDLKSWIVHARHFYDLGEGQLPEDRMEEWELRSGDDTIFLSRDVDDEVCWTLTRKVPVAKIGNNIRKEIIENDDPPETIVYDGVEYYMESYGAAEYYKNCEGPPQPVVFWEYEDEDGERVITVEQWGERDVEAGIGHYVDDYHFSNILPGSD